MLEWIQSHDISLGWLAAASAITFVATLVAVPWLVVRIPADYFANGNRRKPWDDFHPLVSLLLNLGKNLLGLVFIVAGILMLVLPGQGLLTLLVGVLLLDFPGKRRLERWLVTRSPVLRSINWLRRCAGRVPLVIYKE